MINIRNVRKIRIYMNMFRRQQVVYFKYKTETYIHHINITVMCLNNNKQIHNIVEITFIKYDVPKIQDTYTISASLVSLQYSLQEIFILMNYKKIY